MDNRFTIKDIVTLLLIAVVGLLVLLSLWQNQRHWARLDETMDELNAQREALDTYVREQEALRAGLEQMTENLGEMTKSINALVDEIKEQEADTDSQTGLGVPEDLWAISFDPRPIDYSQTFFRVAGLEERADFAQGDFFIDAFGATVKTLTPLVSGDIYADRIQGYVLETLLRLDPQTLEFKPWIAESWAVSDDSLTFTFKMREDVKFSDGVPLTAHDVQFTFEWIMNPKVAAPRERSSMQKIESVEAIDDYTVRFTLREPYYSALGLCGEMDILARHFYGDMTEDQFNQTPGLLFGSGPYKLREDPWKWKPGAQKIEVVRNENYWGPRPGIDRVIWREILEDTALEAEFRNRETDRLSVQPSSYRKLSRDDALRRQANLYEYEYVSSGYIYIGWNQKKNDRPTVFADKRVRRAMTMLIDREQICSRVYDNLAKPASGPFHPLGWQADKSIKPLPFDPERAGELLDEAGYTDRDGDGVRESADGLPLRFKLICSAGSVVVDQMTLLMQDSMRKAGVDMQLDKLDWPIMQQKIDDRDLDAIMLGWGGSVQSDVYQMFHSEQTKDGGDNYINYVNPEIDELINQARTTIDREKCTELWNKVHAQLHEDQPYTFMYNRKSVVFVDKRLRNLQITKTGLNFAWEYYVPTTMQMHISY